MAGALDPKLLAALALQAKQQPDPTQGGFFQNVPYTTEQGDPAYTMYPASPNDPAGPYMTIPGLTVQAGRPAYVGATVPPGQPQVMDPVPGRGAPMSPQVLAAVEKNRGKVDVSVGQPQIEGAPGAVQMFSQMPDPMTMAVQKLNAEHGAKLSFLDHLSQMFGAAPTMPTPGFNAGAPAGQPLSLWHQLLNGVQAATQAPGMAAPQAIPQPLAPGQASMMSPQGRQLLQQLVDDGGTAPDDSELAPVNGRRAKQILNNAGLRKKLEAQGYDPDAEYGAS